jgi:hypothetical protein
VTLGFVVILLITIEPTKVAAFFAGLTAGTEPPLKRSTRSQHFSRGAYA